MINGKKIIALCTSRVYDVLVYGFIKKLNETLQKENAHLLIFAINSDIYWDESAVCAETYVYDIMPYNELDCILIMDEKIKSHTVSDRIIKRAKSENVPVIVVDGDYEGTVKIGFDFEAGFEAIARHVIEDHHARRPHMMAGFKGNPFSIQREEVFKKILADNNIPFDESMISYGEFWADPTREATKEILKRDVLPDAIICANDIMAINVSAVLQDNGYRVPEDVMVSGFDGFEEVFYVSPKIATSSCDTTLLAEESGRLALKLASGEPAGDIHITPKLIPNESCGCKSAMSSLSGYLANFNNNFYRHQDDTRILYNVSSNMETSEDIPAMASCIHNIKTNNSLTVVDNYIFDFDKNYFMTDINHERTPDFHIIYDADYADKHSSELLSVPKEVFHDTTVNTEVSVLSGNFRERILSLMESGYPLLFNSLDYMNKPFGFNCYYYREFVITNYSKSTIVTNGISNGIGGFVNLQCQKNLIKKMDDMYKHDSLTGLFNRVGFQNAYDTMKELPENQGKPVTVIMSDLDGLKLINDSFGHAFGDKSIVAVADALKRACPPEALCARYGGDELFAVVFGKCNPDEIIRKIEAYLNLYNQGTTLPYATTSSSGAFTGILGPDFEFKKALKLADDNMYIAKNRKRTGIIS
ncbi:MAG: GGDEF domain-containing protein [Eubacterium sp.]|nr:GGDEF domain-containing protein [Eubacterium sp.]